MFDARWIKLLTFVLLFALLAAGWNELPHWRAGGAQPVRVPSVSWGRSLLTCPATGDQIAIYGDSHVAGTNENSAVLPFGKVTQLALASRFTVDLFGVGGDTAGIGEQRWLHAGSDGNLVVLAYGSNDAAPRGWLSSKRPVRIEAFAGSLQRQINHWRAEGSRVALLAPPPGGSESIAARMAAYRKAVMAVGHANSVPVMDPADAFAGCGTTEPLLGYDALHMTAAGHACLGKWLAEQLCPSLD